MAMEPARRKLLQTLWVDLLENVTNYQGIIDGLHSREILTRPMKEKVELKQGADKMREILDILPKRGNKAFDIFYEVLVKCGEDVAADILCPERKAERESCSKSGVQVSGGHGHQSLHDDDELPLPDKWPNFDVHDPTRMTVTNVPSSDVQMNRRFEKAKTGSGDVYPMCREKRGIFLLLSNEFFKEARGRDVKLADRDGTAKDCQALDSLFTQLGFKVVKKFNLSAQEMLDAVHNQGRQDHTGYDCFACAVLTHGERDHVYGTDGQLVSLDDLKGAVDGDNSPTLIGKPRLFFIQACQGTLDLRDRSAVATEIDTLVKELVGVEIRDTTESDAASEGRISWKSGVFVAMATVADYVSWRNTSFGTWFIQAIVYVFSHYAHKCELLQLMIMVNRLVSRAETPKGLKQVSTSAYTFTKTFYFFPGLPQVGVVQSHPGLPAPQLAAGVWQDIIQKHYALLLRELIDPSGIVRELYSRFVINHGEKEYVEKGGDDKTKKARLERLLEILMYKGDNVREDFEECLDIAGYKTVAEILRNTRICN